MATRQEQKRRAREQREARERQAARAEQRKRVRSYAAGGLLGAVVIAALVAVSLAGGDEGQGAGGGGGGAAEAGHIHGLGINPADGSLYIATHAGLFRAARGSTEAPRVGTSDRDLMGFSVVGPDHFVASGHPGSESDLPGNIGLTESRDGGQTWEPVSLLGEADFHVLRASGQRIYGYDGVNGRFMLSTDLGRNWMQREVPAVPFDLAIDPKDPDHLIAATDSGLRESRDAGRSWRNVSEQIALLAWGDEDTVFSLTLQGEVGVSRDGGKTARPTGTIQGQPVGFIAAKDGLYVALADGTVLKSTDDGASFAVRARL